MNGSAEDVQPLVTKTEVFDTWVFTRLEQSSRMKVCDPKPGADFGEATASEPW